MARKITPHLMFEGKAREAMEFYVSLFPGSEVVEANYYGPEGPGAEGTVLAARFRLGEQAFQCSDSFVNHEFTFTPANSIFVECESEDEFEKLYSELSEGGKLMMPADNYGFSSRFGWVNDRFGVSWQLNLA